MAKFLSIRQAAVALIVSATTLVPVRVFPMSAAVETAGQDLTRTLTLEECLRLAFEKNHSRPASRFAVAVAEAQHRQALASYWPQIDAKAGITRMSAAPDFLFPASQMYIPSQSVTVPGGQALVTIPANAFGPGFPPVQVQLPVAYPGQSITTPAQLFAVPAQDVRVMDQTTSTAEASLKFLVFDGGMRSGLSEQTLGGIDAAKADQRRTDLELTDSVTRLYFGAVLARQLRELGEDTLARLETTVKITESLYQSGSGSVTKADYLEARVMVETVRSTVVELEKNEESSQAALAYTLGLAWNETVLPAAHEIPYQPDGGQLAELVAGAYDLNPDWLKVGAGMRALEGERKTAFSAYLPKFAFTADAHRFWNDYSAGLATSRNKSGWSVGFGGEIPIFNGFLTRAKVAETDARLNRLKEEKFLLHEGIGLQLRTLVIGLRASEKTCDADRDAKTAAVENSDISIRGYGAGLLSTEKVIRAQIEEALVSAAWFKAIYDHRALQSQIDTVVGKGIQSEIHPVGAH